MQFPHYQQLDYEGEKKKDLEIHYIGRYESQDSADI